MGGWKLEDLEEYRDKRITPDKSIYANVKAPSTPEADLLPNIPMDTTPKKSGISLPNLMPKIQSGLTAAKNKFIDIDSKINPTFKSTAKKTASTIGKIALNNSPLGMVNNVAKLGGTDLNGMYGLDAMKDYIEAHQDTPTAIKPLGFLMESANRVPLAQRIKVSAGNYLDNPAMNFDGSAMEAKSTGNKLLDKTADFAGGLAGQALVGNGPINMLNATDDIAQYAGSKVGGKILPSLVRGATDAAAGTLLEDIGKGKGLKETAKDTLTNAAFGAGLFGLGKIGSEVLQGRGADLITTSKNTYGQGIDDLNNAKGMTFKQNGQSVKQEILPTPVKETPVQLPNKPQDIVKTNSDINSRAVQDNVPMTAKQASIPKIAHTEESISKLNSVEEIDKVINELKEQAANSADDNFKGLIMNLQLFAEKKKTELSKLYQSINESEFIAPEVKAELKNSKEKMYAKDTNQRQWDDATANVKGDFEGTLSRITTKEAFDSADDVAEGFALIDELQKRGDYKSAAALAESMIPKSRKLGQAVQAHSIIGRLSPEGVLQYTARQYEKANTQLPEGKKIKLTEDKAKALVEKAKEIKGMPDGRMKELAQNELLMKTMEDIPVTLARKISTIQAMAQLLNVKTTLRNILGNTAFNVAETISNLYALPYDRAIKAIGKTGNKTVGLPELKAFGQGFKQRGLESIEEVHKGIDLNDYDKYNVKTKNVFKNPVLQKLEKTMGYTLKVPDEAFKGGIAQDSLAQQMKLAGVTTPTEEMIKQANKEAAFRTFQDDSLPAQLLQGAKELLNKVGIGNKIQGASGMKTREFGVGDLVIKYTKVPGNIIARTLEYSPLGFLKTVGLLHDAKVTGKLNQRDLAMTLGRATNGTMMIGMGVLMDRLGLLKSEDKDMDKDAKELDRAAGLGTYKLNLSALNRVISSGSLDAQELKEGDVLTAYNWLQPVSTAFAIGAAINNELGKTDAKKSLASRVGSAGLEEVLDIPTLTIIQQMFYESQKTDSNAFDIMTVPIKQAIPGFIPSQARQIAQTVDPVYRDTKGDTGGQTFVNSLKANIPGLSNSLLPRISPTGEEKKNQLPLLNLFNPAQTTKYQPQEITPKLKQLEKLTGDVTFYPRSTAPKSFKDNKETIVLNQAEKNTYLKTLGQETTASYNNILKGVDVEKLSEDRRKQLIKQLNSAIDKASDKAKKTIVEGRK